METTLDVRLIFRRQNNRRTALFWFLGVFTLALIFFNIKIGPVIYTTGEIFQSLLNPSDTGDLGFAVWTIRLPRTLATVVGGASLAVSGLLLQVYFRNPIVSPFILGISSGATLAVSLVMLTTFGIKLTIATPFLFTIAGCVGSYAVMLLVVTIAARIQSGTTLLVVGMMIGYVCSAVVSIITALAERDKLKGFMLWGMGSFSGFKWNELIIMFLLGGALLLSIHILAKPLNAFLIGEDYAASMGVNIRRFRIFILLASSSLAGLVTSLVGPVAFIGLAVPHMARLSFGTSDNRVLIPGTCLLGAAVTSFCDLIARMWLSPVELPISSITACFMSPIIIILLLRRNVKM
jgi:iron complex transport system permease protein